MPDTHCHKYVTPRTTSESSTGDTGNPHRNAVHTSDFRRYARQPRAPKAAPSTKDTAATTNTQELTVDVDVAAVIPASHSAWPTINPPIPATQIAALKS